MVMFNFTSNIKLKVLNFGCVMAVSVTVMYISFQMNLWVSLKVAVQLI